MLLPVTIPSHSSKNNCYLDFWQYRIVLPVFVLYVSGFIRHMFYVLFLLLSIMFVRFIHVVCSCSSFSIIAEWYLVIWICNYLFVHPNIDGYLLCFQCQLQIMLIPVHISWYSCVHISVKHNHRTGISGSQAKCLFHYNRWCQNGFTYWLYQCIVPQAVPRVPVAPHLHQH